MKKIIIINGPNLNLLGTREPEIYGRSTLADIEEQLNNLANKLAVGLDFHQSNHEGVLIDLIQEAIGKYDGLIINPAGLSHVSIALADALRAFPNPMIEVHLSNLNKREEYRQHSYISEVADGVICGLGAIGYELALRGLVTKIHPKNLPQ